MLQFRGNYFTKISVVINIGPRFEMLIYDVNLSRWIRLTKHSQATGHVRPFRFTEVSGESLSWLWGQKRSLKSLLIFNQLTLLNISLRFKLLICPDKLTRYDYDLIIT